MGENDIPFERIGGYRILRRLATGGTSDVLLARAEGPHGFERTVVLKLLLQQFRREAPMEKMFAREAAAYARLSHPAIVKLYDFFSAEGQLVMVLEYVDGLPLNRFRAMLRKLGDALDDRASIFVASRVFAALAAAHGARDPETGEFAPVIHRDVNPSNVLIPWDGHVKLADFGIAKVAGVSSDTQAGYIKGTYGYMAPEQVRGEPVTVRTDVYAASLLLWELLARRKAIQRGALPEMEVLRAMAEPSIPSLDVLRPDLPARLREAVARGLEPVPDQRSFTAEEMLVVLRESVTSNEGRNVLVDLLGRVRPTTTEVSTQSKPPGPVTPGAPASPDATAQVPVPEARGTEPSVSAAARTALGLGQVAALAVQAATEKQATRGATAPMDARPAEPEPIPPPPPAPPPPRATAKMTQTAAFGATEPDTAPARAAGLTKGLAARTLVGMSPMAYQLTQSQDATTPPPPAPEPAPPATQPMGAATAPLELAPTMFAGAPYSPSPPSFHPPAPVDPFALAPSVVSPVARTHVSPAASTPPPFAPATNGHPGAPPMAVPLSSPPPRMAGAVDPNEVTVSLGGGKGGTYALVAGIALVASAVVVAGLWFAKSATNAPPSKTTTTIASSTASTATAPATGTSVVAAPPAASATVAASASAPAPTPSAAPPAATSPTPAASAVPSSVAVAPTATQAPPAEATPPAVVIPPNMGRILSPVAAGSHRVFVDGRYAGDTPAPVLVKCGAHKVKIGSRGAERDVDVPCGADVTLVGH